LSGKRREFAERAEDETYDGVCVRSVKGAVLKSLASIGLTVPCAVPWSWWSRERAFDKYCLGISAARCSAG
jgi:hypothetical protein